MLLSVPITMVVKIALESNPSTRWTSIQLDSEASVIQSVGNKTHKPRPDSSSSAS
jgi:hypothetical protein